MKTERTFWRLLGDYERLTRDETLAVKEQNFAVVSELNAKKNILINEMESLGKTLGIDRSNPAFKSRIDLLIETEQNNTVLVSERILKMRCERDILENATKRLRSFERAYTWDSRSEKHAGHFCAAG